MTAFKRCRIAILSAPDERAVRSLLVECLSEIQEEISMLPPRCQEILAEQAPDLHAIAVVLLWADLSFTGDSAVGAVLKEVANIHAAASVRLGQLQRG